MSLEYNSFVQKKKSANLVMLIDEEEKLLDVLSEYLFSQGFSVVALVGHLVAQSGDRIAYVGHPVALVDQLVALVGYPVASAGHPLALIG